MDTVENILENNQAQKDTLNYSGDIEISLMQNKRVLSTKKYHNTGCMPLFRFLVACLRGDWSSAYSLRPCKLAAFDKGKTETSLYPNKVFNPAYWTKKEKVSSLVLYEESPEIDEVKDETGYQITYKFRLPYLCLKNEAKIYKLALYPEEFIELSSDMCAYFILNEEDHIEVPSGGGNFTIIVKWTLKVINAPKAAN